MNFDLQGRDLAGLGGYIASFEETGTLTACKVVFAQLSASFGAMSKAIEGEVRGKKVCSELCIICSIEPYLVE